MSYISNAIFTNGHDLSKPIELPFTQETTLANDIQVDNFYLVLIYRTKHLLNAGKIKTISLNQRDNCQGGVIF